MKNLYFFLDLIGDLKSMSPAELTTLSNEIAKREPALADKISFYFGIALQDRQTAAQNAEEAFI
jgi:hypothetical protein